MCARSAHTNNVNLLNKMDDNPTEDWNEVENDRLVQARCFRSPVTVIKLRFMSISLFIKEV